MYHKQAIDLAHELTNFVLPETESNQERNKLTWPEPKEVEEVFAKLLKSLYPVDDADLTTSASLVNHLGLDSLDHVELVMHCEREFGITLEDKDWQKLCTLGDWVTMLKTKITERNLYQKHCLV